MTNISDKLLDGMIKEGIISDENKEIYLFGIKELFSQIFTYLVVLGIGLAFHMLIQTIVFIAAYMALRVYAGGYHAPTQFRCYVLSFGMIIAALLLIKWIDVTGFAVLAGIAFMGLIIYLLAPSEHKNKPLSQNEKKVYKKKVGQRVIVYFTLSLAAVITGVAEVATTIGIAMMFLIFMMIGNLHTGFKREQKKDRMVFKAGIQK